MKTNPNPHISKLNELLSAYYERRISSPEAHQLEKHALDDPFLSEAMEGFDEFPNALNAIPDFKQRSSHLKWVSIFSVSLLAVLGVYYFGFNKEEIVELKQVRN